MKRLRAKKMRIRAALGQLRRMKGLRERLGESGYAIYAVATWYRRHRADFVASKKGSGYYSLFVVRVAKNGVIEIRPYHTWANYWPVSHDLAKLNEEFGLVRVRWYLPLCREYGGPLAFVDERDHGSLAAQTRMAMLFFG